MINIGTYAVPKRNGDGLASSSKVIISNTGGNGNNFEPHYLWGQYFDDTQDIKGEIKGATNIYASGTIQAGAIIADSTEMGELFVDDLTVNNKVTAKNLEAETGTINTLTSEQIYSTAINNDGQIDTKTLNVSVSAFIKELLATDITTENLTVTKAAHFFKLIIDEIKASKGQIIVTPANAKLDLVETISGGYRCYFRASDADGNEIFNSFEKNDQIIHQTFNAATGTSYNVSNSYYWRLCTNVSTAVVNKTINGQSVACWYIDLSDSDKDTYSNSAPKAGDEIVMLGNRTDTSRQAAIIISAYNNTYLDPEIKSPSIVQYSGIKSYQLKPYRLNIISNGLNSFKGVFNTTTGKDIEDLIQNVSDKADEYTDTYLHIAWANSADGKTDFTKVNNGGDYLYIGMKSDFTESDSALRYTDYKWSRLKGQQGTSVTVTSKSISYQVSDSGTDVPTGTWTQYVPVCPEGKWLWTRTIVNYSDGNSTTSYSVSRNGVNGVGVTITSKSVTYQASTSGTTVPTGTWQTSVPTVSKGQYLWTKTYIKYSDGTETTAYSVSYNAVNGDDAEFYTLSPVTEKAIVDKDGTLGVSFSYNIIHVKGSTTSTITASKSGYWVRVKPDNSNTYYDCSVSTTSPTYTNTSFQKNYHTANSKPTTFTVYLVYGTGATVKNQYVVPVVFDAAATLTITDSIKSTVQGQGDKIDSLDGTVSSHTSAISTIQQNYNSISSTVSSHTTSINNLNGTVSGHTTSISNLTQTSNSISTRVTTIEGDYAKSSEITQTANEIKMLVGNCGLDLTNEKIILNGDTEVNGTLTLTDAGQGFVFQGSGGSTIISPQSIGSYSSFQSKATNTVVFNTSSTRYIAESVGSSTVNAQFSYSQNLGTIKSGSYITLSTQSLSFRKNNSSAILTPTSLSVKYTVYQGSSVLATFSNTVASRASIGSFTTTSTAQIRVDVYVSANFYSSSFSNTSDPVKFVDMPAVVGTCYYKTAIPTDAFTLIGYDGIGMNFGTQNTVYFGAEGAYLKYGSHALKVSSSGVQKLDPNGSSRYVGLSTKKVTLITSSTYTITDSDDFIIFTGTAADCTISLPSPSNNKGRVLYFKDGSDGREIKVTGSIRKASSQSGSSQTLEINNIPYMFVSDGSYWNAFYCG